MKKFLVILFLIFISTLSAQAESIYVSGAREVKSGETFSIFVNADSEGKSINTMAVTLSYPSELLSFTGYREDHSVIKYWIQKPQAEGGHISFSGIVPGGINGVYDPAQETLAPIPLTELIFTAKKEGFASFSFLNQKFFLNDGLATELAVNGRVSDITIVPSVPLEQSADLTKPEPFTILFLNSSVFAKSPALLLFEAKDQDSGIQSYQIKIGNGDWQSGQSPLAIRRKNFAQEVTIRAIDYYGNYRDSSIVVPGILSNTIVIGFLASLLILLALYHRRRILNKLLQK